MPIMWRAEEDATNLFKEYHLLKLQGNLLQVADGKHLPCTPNNNQPLTKSGI